jgi:Flp pilus assembly pilin Flp
MRKSLSRQRGQTSLEYFVVVAFGVLVLIEGGNSSAMSQVVTALKDLYQGYAYAISYATNLNAL